MAAITAGFVHAAAAVAHRHEGADHLAFFAVVAVAQLAWGALSLTRPSRLLFAAGAAGNAVVLAVWAVSRSIGGEPVGAADVLATAAEVVAVVGALRLLRHGEVRPALGSSWTPVGGVAVLLVVALAAAPLLEGTVADGHRHAHGERHAHADVGEEHAHAGGEHVHAGDDHDEHHGEQHGEGHRVAHGGHEGAAHAHAAADHDDHDDHDDGNHHASDDHHAAAEPDGGGGGGQRGVRFEPATDERGAAIVLPAGPGGVTHHHPPDDGCRPTPEQRTAADRVATATRAELAKYDGNPARAARDGFVPLPIPSERHVHMLNLARIKDPTILDASEIESFLYAVTDRGLVAIGGMYVMPTREATGPEFGGCLTRWHRHTGASGRILTGGQSDRTAEMLHVWTYPGLDPYGEYGGREFSQLWTPGSWIPSVCSTSVCF